MKNKINEALPKLKDGKTKVSQSSSELKKAYTSQTAKNKDKDFQTVITNVGSVINKLNNSVLPAIETKINQLNNQIQAKRNEISSLKYELSCL